MIHIDIAKGAELDEIGELLGMERGWFPHPHAGHQLLPTPDGIYRAEILKVMQERKLAQAPFGFVPVSPAIPLHTKLEEEIETVTSERLDEIGKLLQVPRNGSDDSMYRKRMLILIRNGMLPGEVTRLVPKGMSGTCGTVVDDLAGRLATMDTIYAVVKDKDGTSHVYWKGTMDGVAFAILMLQDAALDALNGR